MTSPRFLFFLLVPLAVLIAGCGSPDESGGSSSESTAPVPAGPAAEWSYEGDRGPAQWADLSTAYATCDSDRQSPVALSEGTPPRRTPKFSTSYSTAKGKVIDTGHAIQVNLNGGTLTYSGTTYTLQQFHVHTPAEHTIDGTTHPAELHLVHQSDDELAVLGIFLEESETENPSLNNWIGETPDSTVFVKANRFLPDTRGYYTYAGSLTTPPCSENVRWIVMTSPIPASREQLNTLRDRHDGNARPVQPLGDRRLTYVGP